MMHTLLHEFFLFQVVLAIENELQSIRNGSDGAALFAQDVKGAGSGEVSFPIDDVVSKHNPDASFWHKNARYPGVIVEVSYSHKRKIDRLAESYLLDSKGGVQVVVVLDIAYGKRRPRKATLSVWRSRIYDTVDGKELRVFQEVKNEVCCILDSRFEFLTFYSFYRRFVTIREIQQVIQAYDFNSETLQTKKLHKLRSAIRIENSRSPLKNCAKTLMRRKFVTNGTNNGHHAVGAQATVIQSLLKSKSEKSRERLSRRSIPMMKRSMLRKSNEQKSMRRTMTLIIKIDQSSSMLLVRRRSTERSFFFRISRSPMKKVRIKIINFSHRVRRLQPK